MPHDIFVSYSQPDRECALEIVTRVEGCGLSCWVAPRDISPAADWAAEIIDAISNARLMVLIFSASSNDSPQVRREVERAVHRQLRILTFRIENVLPSKSLEYFLSSQHWLNAFPPPRETHYERLCSHLRTALATAPAVASSAVASSAAASMSARKEGTAAAAVFAPPLLRSLEIELAACIGPIARHLVTRAAARAASAEELQTRLMAELDSERDRVRFLEACRRLRQSRE